jgi:hypothetical protein
MKLIKVLNNVIPPVGYKAITLFPFIFIRRGAYGRFLDRDLNHESIHAYQEVEMLYVFFLLWYVLEYIFRLFQYEGDRDKAYRNISFEREAYFNEGNQDYLKNRMHYSWIKYLRIKTNYYTFR